jgi:hypothetical protein
VVAKQMNVAFVQQSLAAKEKTVANRTNAIAIIMSFI